MIPIQIILAALLAGIAALYIYSVRSRLISRITAIALITIGVLFVLNPGWTHTLAHAVGVGRGADLVFYLLAVAGAYAIVILSSQVRSLDRKLTMLVRELAIRLAGSAAAALPDAARPEAAAKTSPNRLGRWFWPAAVFFGLGYVFVMPPFQAPDESVHFIRTYRLSQGNCLAANQYKIPASFFDMERMFPPNFVDLRTFSAGEIAGWIRVPANEAFGAPLDRNSSYPADTYGCLPYVPAAAGMRVALVFADSAGLAYLFARLANLAAYLLLVGLALHYLPWGHLYLAAVALMPMALHQGAAFSADGMTNGLAFLMCAYVFHLAWSPKVERIGTRHVAMLALVIAALAWTKPIGWLAALVLLVPCSRFRSNRSRWLFAGGMMLVSVLVTVGWQFINADSVRAFDEHRTARDIPVAQNREFLRNRPLAVAPAIVRTLRVEWTTYVTQMVGAVGTLAVYLPIGHALLYCLLLLVLATGDGPDPAPTWTNRLWALALVAGGTLLIFLVLVTTDTTSARLRELQAGAGVIPGFQGRYWIPMLLAAAIPVTGWGRRFLPSLSSLTGVVVIAINLFTLWLVLDHFHADSSSKDLTALTPGVAVEHARTPEAAPELTAGHRYGQTFVASHRGLAAIDLQVATYHRRMPYGVIMLRLKRSPDALETLAETRVDAATIRDNHFVTLRFAPIKDSRGRSFYFELEPETLPPGQPVTVWVGPGDILKDGQFFADGQAFDRDCAFRTYHSYLDVSTLTGGTSR
ncbi:MAG: DUF2304 family protein [Bryobacteraceae bacterium]